MSTSPRTLVLLSLVALISGGCETDRRAIGHEQGLVRPSHWALEEYTPPGAQLPGELREQYVAAGGEVDVSRQVLWFNTTSADALPYWEAMTRESPESAVAWSGLAATAMRANRTELARSAGEKAEDADPRLGYGYAAQALALHGQGDVAAAMRTLKRGILSASDQEGRWLLSRLLLDFCRQRQDYEPALEAAQRLIDREHVLGWLGYPLKGGAYLLQGDFARAREMADEAREFDAHTVFFPSANAIALAALANLWSGEPDPFEPFTEYYPAPAICNVAWLIHAIDDARNERWHSALLAAEAYYVVLGRDGLLKYDSAPVVPVEKRLWSELLGQVIDEAGDIDRMLLVAIAHQALGNDAEASQAFAEAAYHQPSSKLARAGLEGEGGRELAGINKDEVLDLIASRLVAP